MILKTAIFLENFLKFSIIHKNIFHNYFHYNVFFLNILQNFIINSNFIHSKRNSYIVIQKIIDFRTKIIFSKYNFFLLE